MKMPIQKIESAVQKKDVRNYLQEAYQEAYFDKDKGRLVATDDHICAIVPVTDYNEDSAGYISPDAMKHARKIKTDTIAVNGSINFPNGTSMSRSELGKFPDYEKVVPKKPKGEPTICIDAALLLKLAQAINIPSADSGTSLKLWITGSKDVIYVEGNSDAYGAIMPRRF